MKEASDKTAERQQRRLERELAESEKRLARERTRMNEWWKQAQQARMNGEPMPKYESKYPYLMQMGWVEDAVYAKRLEIFVQPGTYHIKCMNGTFHEPFRMNEGWERPPDVGPVAEFGCGETEYKISGERDVTIEVPVYKSVIYGFVLPGLDDHAKNRIMFVIHWLSENTKEQIEQEIRVGITGIQKLKYLRLRHNVRTSIEFYINENTKQLEML